MYLSGEQDIELIPFVLVSCQILNSGVQELNSTHSILLKILYIRNIQSFKMLVKLADIVGLKIKKSIWRGCCVADGRSCGLIQYIAISHFRLDLKLEKKVWKVFVCKSLLAIA
jgi:hypothetical protein